MEVVNFSDPFPIEMVKQEAFRKSNEVVGKQCGGGCRDLSFQRKTEQRQKGIVLRIKELETLVSLPLVLCLCKSATLWPFLPTYNTGQDLSPLFPAIWRQIRKEK